MARGGEVVCFCVFSKMFRLYTLGAPFIDQPKPGLSFVFSEPRTERGQLFMLLRLLRRL